MNYEQQNSLDKPTFAGERTTVDRALVITATFSQWPLWKAFHSGHKRAPARPPQSSNCSKAWSISAAKRTGGQPHNRSRATTKAMHTGRASLTPQATRVTQPSRCQILVRAAAWATVCQIRTYAPQHPLSAPCGAFQLPANAPPEWRICRPRQKLSARRQTHTAQLRRACQTNGSDRGYAPSILDRPAAP